MNINTKKKNYSLLTNGYFGNILRTWGNYNDLLKSDYYGYVSMRYQGSSGGFNAEYNVKYKDILSKIKEWELKGLDRNNIVFNESAPDSYLKIQGEVMRRYDGLVLYYSHVKDKMRIALQQDSSTIKGIIAAEYLKYYMTPSSYNDLNCLLDLYDNHVVEFSTYSYCLGNIPGRNTIIWEVRNY